MWKRSLDIFPGEWARTEHEPETEKELEIGDKAKVVVDSQFQDYYPDMEERLPRRIGQIGIVIEIDTGDEWAYKLNFGDGTNWFKRYILEKV